MKEEFKIDEQLLAEAQRLGQHATKEEALNEYVARRKQLEILELFGQVEYDPAYDYKQERRARKQKPGSNKP
jgi:hypothetical protein